MANVFIFGFQLLCILSLGYGLSVGIKSPIIGTAIANNPSGLDLPSTNISISIVPEGLQKLAEEAGNGGRGGSSDLPACASDYQLNLDLSMGRNISRTIVTKMEAMTEDERSAYKECVQEVCAADPTGVVCKSISANL